MRLDRDFCTPTLLYRYSILLPSWKLFTLLLDRIEISFTEKKSFLYKACKRLKNKSNILIYRIIPLVNKTRSRSSSLALFQAAKKRNLFPFRSRISREKRHHFRGQQRSPFPPLAVRPRAGEKRNRRGNRTIHAAGVSRCGPRPNEFAHTQAGPGRADFCRLAARSVQFALHLLQIGLPSFLARGRVEGGAPSASISHEKRGRIPSQSDNPAACPACPARSALFTSSRRVIRENCGPFRVKRMQQQRRPPSSFVDVEFLSLQICLRMNFLNFIFRRTYGEVRRESYSFVKLCDRSIRLIAIEVSMTIKIVRDAILCNYWRMRRERNLHDCWKSKNSGEILEERNKFFFFEIPSLDVSGRCKEERNDFGEEGIYNRCSGNDVSFWRMIVQRFVEEQLLWLGKGKS